MSDSFQFEEDRKNKRVYVNLLDATKITQRSIRSGFFMLGKDLKSNANREILRKPKSGRTYIIRTRSGRRRRHTASAPGETHANLTGAVRRSLSWQVTGSTQLEFGYGVGIKTTEYAKMLENGTKNMDARPSLGNAVRETNRNGELYFNQAYRKLMK